MGRERTVVLSNAKDLGGVASTWTTCRPRLCPRPLTPFGVTIGRPGRPFQQPAGALHGGGTRTTRANGPGDYEALMTLATNSPLISPVPMTWPSMASSSCALVVFGPRSSSMSSA